MSAFHHRCRSLHVSGEHVLGLARVRAHRGGRNNVKILCPRHDDTDPSCSVHLETGQAFCFACGFRAGDAVALHHALGKFTSMSDALRDLEQRAGSPVPQLEIRAVPSSKRPRRERHDGVPIEVRRWTYRADDGSPAFDVVRLQFRLPDATWEWDADKGKPRKESRPAVPGSDRWGMPEPYASGLLRPLYGLPEIVAAPLGALIYVVEGEPCVEALAGIGWLATTSSGGASNANRTDWSPLAGRRVAIWPDNDAAGAGYADQVISILSRLESAPVIQRVAINQLSLPVGGDAVDWIAARRRNA
jgi:hypothetical protein